MYKYTELISLCTRNVEAATQDCPIGVSSGTMEEIFEGESNYTAKCSHLKSRRMCRGIGMAIWDVIVPRLPWRQLQQVGALQTLQVQVQRHGVSS
jgi:hypothetical protein